MLAVAVLSALAAFTSLPAVEGVAVRGLGVIQERAEVEGHSLGSCKAPLLTYHIAAKHTFGLAFPDGSGFIDHGEQKIDGASWHICDQIKNRCGADAGAIGLCETAKTATNGMTGPGKIQVNVAPDIGDAAAKKWNTAWGCPNAHPEKGSCGDTGDDNTGGDNTGGDNTGGDNTGGDNTGGDNTGGDNTGANNGTTTATGSGTTKDTGSGSGTPVDTGDSSPSGTGQSYPSGTGDASSSMGGSTLGNSGTGNGASLNTGYSDSSATGNSTDTCSGSS